MRAVVVVMMMMCGIAQAAEPKSVTNTIGMELIEIPAGKFTMGSPEGEKDRHHEEEQVAVTLTKPFGLGKTEVTQGQWKQVMGTEPWEGEGYVQVDKECPATFVSFFDAVEFCDKLTDLERKAGELKADEEYRLPTEAEWEYACRAGTTTAFSFGDESKINSHAWWGGLDTEVLRAGEGKPGPGNAGREKYAHKVGTKKPNQWGLYDMHGNVWELCSDWHGEKLPGGTDPMGPEAGSNRVLRGGSWGNRPGLHRTAFRDYCVPSAHSHSLGFRVALCIGGRGVTLAETLDKQVVRLFHEGKYAEAEPLALQSLEVSLKKNGRDHASTAMSLNNLAWLYKTQGKYDLAEPLLKRALAIREKVLGPDHASTATSLGNLASLYDNQGKYDLAEPLYKRALAIQEKALGPDHADTATSLNNLASLYDTQGKYDLAEPLYKRALAIQEKALGPDHPSTATSLNNLAMLYATQGKYDLAEPLYKRAVAIQEKALGPDHPSTANSLNSLATLYATQGKYDLAKPLYKRALAIREKVLGPDHVSTATSLGNLASLYKTQGKYDLAEPLFKRALAIREKVLGPDHVSTATSLGNLASLYETQGKYDLAEPLFKRAIAILDSALGASHPDTILYRKNLAQMKAAREAAGK